ncbi:hypothetical protein [Streptomyces griseorubiginosus]|uniref:hypothetical protein n=1 Tax=Streptomyces griseorubiginosus TaxID=67304 RepID=UPI0013C42B97|nr:hypothetical protein [Streptomyces griseorubiginosus]
MSRNTLDGQELTHKIGRSFLLFKVPILLVIALLLMLVWEIIRVNLEPAARKSGVWQLVLLDRSSAASLLAVAVGLTFARAQYARAVRPLIGWSAEAQRNDRGMNGRHIWYVEMQNGGTHGVAVDEVSYRLRHRQGWGGEWVNHQTMVQGLERLNLEIGKDFDLNTIGQGAVLGNCYVGRFSEPATKLLEDFEIRVRVTDAAGDRHERTLHCLRGAETELRSAAARQ